MKAILQILLGVAILALGYWLFILFDTPLKFNSVRVDRETVVIERLKDIRTAQRAYRAKYAKFAGSFDQLINFVQNDSMEVTLMIGSEYDSAAVAAGQVKHYVSYVPYKDTIFNHRSVGFDVAKIRYIPFSDKATGSLKEFKMDTVSFLTESKMTVPVFEAYAPYVDFLGDLDKQELINYRDIKVNTLKRADGLKVGSLESANNEAGNWE
ncbi:MAG: hypothetical protein RR689_00030 [Mucinivorans sp.]